MKLSGTPPGRTSCVLYRLSFFKNIILLGVFVFSLISYTALIAQPCQVIVSGGSWSDKATWAQPNTDCCPAGTFPPCSDETAITPTKDMDVIIPSDMVVIVESGELAFAKDVTIEGILSFQITTLESAPELRVHGDWTNNGVFTYRRDDATIGTATDYGTVAFDGGHTHQLISSGANIPAGDGIGDGVGETFWNLKVRLDDHLNMLDSISVENDFSFGETPGSVNRVYLNDHSIRINKAIHFASELRTTNKDRYFVTNGLGYVHLTDLNADSARQFPVGYDATSFTPCEIDNTGAEDDFRVRACNAMYTDGTCDGGDGGTVIDEYAAKVTWHIDEVNAGGSSVQMTLQWNTDEELASFDPNFCNIFHWGPTWDDAFGESPRVSEEVSSTIRVQQSQSSIIEDFSPYTVMTPVGGTVLGLVEVHLFQDNSSNPTLLRWNIEGVAPTYQQHIEFSQDGFSFELLARVDTSHSMVLSNPKTGFYRIKVLLEDQFVYSNSVYLEAVKTHLERPKLFPNPTSGVFSIRGTNREEPFLLAIYSMEGLLVAQEEILNQGEITIDSLLSRNAGQYIVVLTTSSRVFRYAVIRL